MRGVVIAGRVQSPSGLGEGVAAALGPVRSCGAVRPRSIRRREEHEQRDERACGGGAEHAQSDASSAVPAVSKLLVLEQVIVEVLGGRVGAAGVGGRWCAFEVVSKVDLGREIRVEGRRGERAVFG